ncbi:MAG: complex I NDUFA9 subunit family protein [Gemmatimonadaceae bacterium]
MLDPTRPPDVSTADNLAADAHTAVAEAPLVWPDDKGRVVAVTGASGFVGVHVCRALAETGWRVRALVHNPAKAAARLAHLPVEVRAGDIRDADFVRSALAGATAVVHLAAVAIERGDLTYEAVNASATRTVLDAASHAGVRRFVHMSQNGSDSRSPYRFLRSKGEAQDMVVASALRWTVLKPSVIFGPEDEFVNVIARLVRLTPLVLPLPDGGRAMFQPVFVDDIATVIVRTLQDDSTVAQLYPLGGPVPLTLRQMAERILIAMRAKRTIVGVPIALVKPAVAALERIIPNPPITTGLLDLLSIDNAVPDNTITSVFGVQPTPFAPEELLYLRRITVRSAIDSLFKH